MFDYPEITALAAQDKDIASILDDLFRSVNSTYPSLSRFSIVLTDHTKASNYYVYDLLSNTAIYDYSEQELHSHSSLTNLANTKSVRIIDDLSSIPSTRVQQLLAIGHRSSYTTSIPYKESNLGFIFVNASSTGFFSEREQKRDIEFFAQTIANLFIQQHNNQIHFQNSLTIALNMGHARDPETKEHLLRMGKYSELLARILSDISKEISHQFVHRIRLYAPFHDIGKYRIPDDVLFSSKRFTPTDREIMEKHTIFGEEVIDDVVSITDSNSISRKEVQFIKNIVRHHHERFDGSGLPDSLSYRNIPLEARIVTLADVFDALLSQRAYKEAWSTAKVIAYIEHNSGTLFDPDCVNALTSNLELFIEIRDHYLDSNSNENVLAC
ncbi:HD domain-containing protein [Vibrio makurazakiensis]|uniref:HD-GYP domain-containing protein n=1 Tax=Vibrio makurazakiensis TaxID=2910250 RepID=UPI003D14156E